jgi:hypothetical protein
MFERREIIWVRLYFDVKIKCVDIQMCLGSFCFPKWLLLLEIRYVYGQKEIMARFTETMPLTIEVKNDMDLSILDFIL